MPLLKFVVLPLGVVGVLAGCDDSGAPDISLEASPAQLSAGETTTLSWSVLNADSCTATGAWSQAKATTGTETIGPLTQDSTFGLSCIGPGGASTTAVTVALASPDEGPTDDQPADPVSAPSLNLSTTTDSVSYGESAALSWSASNVDNCTASGAWSGTKAASGNENSAPLSQDSAFTLTCEGPGGSISSTLNVKVVGQPAVVPEVTLAATPAEVENGGTAELTWQTSDVEACTASGAWGGDKGLSGSEVVGPLSEEATFTLSCRNGDTSVSESVTVAVAAAPVQPDPDPDPTPSVKGALSGTVDSSLVDRNGINQVYVYAGNVTPDDIDGDGGDPVLTVPVNQDGGMCSWSYALDSLAAGQYTVAFTNEAAYDDPQQDDGLRFVGTANVSVDSDGTMRNFAAANIIKVGPGRAYATPSAAARVAQDGDVIEIDAGEYRNDIAVWRQNNITLRGVGGFAHLKSTRDIPYTRGNDQENGMGIWVTKGRNITVENVEFSGAAVPDGNGSGIRAEGSNLTICGSYFHDNENGILGGAGHVLIEYSEFNHNGIGEYGKTHNMYITGNRLTLRHSYTHHAHIGHNVKSRAKENYILYNRIMDEAGGDSSYAIDIPNGGLSYVVGNLVQQGPNTDNSTIVAYGAEGLSSGRTHRLYMVNNTVVNDRGAGTFLYIQSGASGKLINNLFVGGGTLHRGSSAVEKVSNLTTTGPGLVNVDSYDYHLRADSPARDAGSAPGIADGFDLTPVYQYVHKNKRESRPSDGRIDIGAYEYN